MKKTEIENANSSSTLRRYLSPLGAWALAFGCSVGWGAFVMPGTAFLPKAGPLGTVIGIAVGALLMLLIGVNYHYMINRYPDAGGAFTFTKKVMGYDQGFLNAWFLVLTYIAVLWANATALALLGRRLLGGWFQFGFGYKLAGYDIYFGEIMVVIAAIVLCGLLCVLGRKLAEYVQILLAFILLFGIAAVFFTIFGQGGADMTTIYPLFAPDIDPFTGTVAIIMITPWAFVGFESISHSAEEFNFSGKKSFGIIVAAVIAAAIAYSLLALIAVAKRPEGIYVTWFQYVSNLRHLGGMNSVPTFYSAWKAMGATGILIITMAVLGGIFTGIIGNYIASSRLLYSMAKDKMIPGWFADLNGFGIPHHAIFFIMAVSVAVPFFGRTAISWIVDVTTIGAVIVYGYTSYAAYLTASKEENHLVAATGLAGMVISAIFALYLFFEGSLEAESYVIFVLWSILGCIFFLYLLQQDKGGRFGKTTTGWMWMVFLIIFTSMIWVQQEFKNLSADVVGKIRLHNTVEMIKYHVTRSTEDIYAARDFLDAQTAMLNTSLVRFTVIQLVLIVIALVIMTIVYKTILRREKVTEQKKALAELSNQAKSTFLSNMSHDIRTPMNAIVGYTTLAKNEKDPAKLEDYMNKIEASSKHLLALINDVLDMGRIESGKMEIQPEPTDLAKMLDELHDLFITQMKTKGLTFSVTKNVNNKFVMCDKNRLDRVLMNLLSNAFKFTPAGGEISVALTQTGADDTKGYYELRVKDTGMGMSPEFAATVFEAFTRERTAEVAGIQGTGLGMSITKSLVELMSGSIDLVTAQGKGTEFIIHVAFDLADEASAEEIHDHTLPGAPDFSSMRILLVEDNVINMEIAMMILHEAGFQVETAENGQIAVNIVKESEPGYYDGVLMDIQMPVMNGYDAAKAIRALPRKDLAELPIVAMTANAFSEDVQMAKDAGMNGHIAKPIDIPKMMETLTQVLKKK